MNEYLKAFFESENIEYYASAEISEEFFEKFVFLPRKLPEWAKYVTVFLIPYNTGKNEQRNVSHYAVSRDYHLYVHKLAKKLCADCRQDVAVFADNSPFDERSLAVCLSLGFIGRNGLLINEKYGSYVFIGEIVTSEPVNIKSVNSKETEKCFMCGKCIGACPSNALCTGKNCVSELTQKKKLEPYEEELVKKHPLVWGCDICQDVCPHNESVSLSPVRFFYEERLPFVTKEDIEEMDDEKFLSRAYSWRGKNVILRNLSFKL